MNNEPAADENPGGFFAHAWRVVRQAHHEGEGLAAKLIGTCSLRQSSRNWLPAILHRPHGELVEPRKNGSAIHLFKRILPTYPTHQNIPYPTTRPFRRECFRKLSKVGKGPAFRPVGDPQAGKVQSNDAMLDETGCRGGWSKGSQQPQHQPKTSALPMDRPSFPPSQQPDATAGVATARRIASNHCAAMAASIRRTASSLSHGAGPFMAAIWQPSLSTIIVTGRPNARFLRLSSLNTPMVGSR